jgi:uncharacterized RDD family membrane protein YckC
MVPSARPEVEVIESGVRYRMIVTPEGVPLRFGVGAAGDRVVALFLDLLLMAVGVLVLLFVLLMAHDSAFTWSAVLVALFLLWTFYFVLLEARRGDTPGKRAMGLRVISRNGGPLSVRAVLARNVTREFEVLLPVAALSGPEQVLPGAPVWVAVLASLWLVVVLFVPLLNRDRLRIGDLLGGTMVVRAPRTVLLPDLSERPPTGGLPGPAFEFTREQLDVYGIYELQVLENLLRLPPEANEAARDVAAKKIREKIGWTGEVTGRDRFLSDFYAAQRGRLEQELLLGRRREKKRR